MPDEPPPTPIEPSDPGDAARDEPDPVEPPGSPVEAFPEGSDELPLTGSPMFTVERDLLDLRENLGRSRAHAWAVDASMTAVFAVLTTVFVLLLWWWWK